MVRSLRVWLCGLCLVALLALPAAADKVRWGPYTIMVEHSDEPSARLRIFDGRGVMRRDIRATFIDVDFPHLSRRGPAALRVVASPNSNILQDRRTLVFSRVGGLHNLLVMPDDFDAIRDLGHDGRRELVVESTALEYVAGVCHGCSPELMLALGWNGHQYVVQNRRFPWLARRKARFYQRKVLAARYGGSDEGFDGYVAPAIGYWANMATIGRSRSARRWLMRHIPRGARQWFLESLPDVRARLARLPRQITVSQQRVFVVSD